MVRFEQEIDPDLRPSPLWALAEELTIVEAAILILGRDPERHGAAESSLRNRPEGYEAVRQALVGACRQGRIKCDIGLFEDENGPIAGEINPAITRVEVESLIAWLRSRGFTTGFFFSGAGSVEPYLDPSHPRYAPKLAAAVEAWTAGDENTAGPGTVKQKLEKWLRENAARFGLSGPDGNPMSNPIDEIAKVANWEQKGGAPKAAPSAPTPPKPAPLSVPIASKRPPPAPSDTETDVPF
jgi:hypothetical protein